MSETEAKEYRVTMAGAGADASEWWTVAAGFGSLIGAARWMLDALDTDNPAVPLRIERKVGPFWHDCLVILPAGVESIKAWESRELAKVLCALLGDFRRACYRDDMSNEEREHFSRVLDMVEGAFSKNLHPAECQEDAETLRVIARYRRALLGDGLSLVERGELAAPGGWLDQVEAFVLAVLA